MTTIKEILKRNVEKFEKETDVIANKIVKEISKLMESKIILPHGFEFIVHIIYEYDDSGTIFYKIVFKTCSDFNYDYNSRFGDFTYLCCDEEELFSHKIEVETDNCIPGLIADCALAKTESILKKEAGKTMKKLCLEDGEDVDSIKYMFKVGSSKWYCEE